MATIQRNTTRNGYKFEVKYLVHTKEEMQDIERRHLGSIPMPVFGMTYEFIEVA